MTIQPTAVGESWQEHTSLGTVEFTPYIGPNGTVGIVATHEGGLTEYIYFNVSNSGEDAGPGGGPGHNVFVYQGETGDPSQDSPLHYYYILEETTT